ncbi:ribose-phosphate pyrophosphokinase [Candidatus Woesebacteria bacterium]|nr:ribose-phosphate pyrophosphokinase [Candidatus Woesebacteria bacterium]
MLKLFSGTSNPNLSKKVAESANLTLGKMEVVRFENSEVRVRIGEDVRNDVCVIIQSTANPTDTNLMELFLICDALRRQEAKKVIGVIPYFGYARQDIQHRPGECISASVIVKFIESIGFHKVYTFDLHDEATEGVFTIPFKNLSALPLLAKEVTTYLQKQGITVDQKSVAIVSPDQGGIERARKFGEAMFGTREFDLALIEKRRDLAHIHESTALALYGDVKGKVAIVVDDVATSGRTLIHAAEHCVQQGAKSAIAVVVHRDFAKDTAKKIQESSIEAFFTTDTIAMKEYYSFEKMKEISVGQTIAETLTSY